MNESKKKDKNSIKKNASCISRIHRKNSNNNNNKLAVLMISLLLRFV